MTKVKVFLAITRQKTPWDSGIVLLFFEFQSVFGFTHERKFNTTSRLCFLFSLPYFLQQQQQQKFSHQPFLEWKKINYKMISLGPPNDFLTLSYIFLIKLITQSRVCYLILSVSIKRGSLSLKKHWVNKEMNEVWNDLAQLSCNYTKHKASS